jgi:hypothetical protein
MEISLEKQVRSPSLMHKYLAIVMALSMALACGCDKRDPEPEESNELAVTEDVRSVQSNPHYAAELYCYIGEIGSGTNCNTVLCDPNTPSNPNVKMTNLSITCGHPGEASKISWEFVEHKEGKDIYRFERIFPVDVNNSRTTSKVVEYAGLQTIVFKDDYQVVVLDLPK